MGSDPQYAKYPNLSLAHHIFVLRTPALAASHPISQNHLTESITKERQAPLYRYLYNPTDGILAGKQPWNEDFYNDLVSKNEEEKEGYEKDMQEAEEKAGETEVTECMGKIAEFYARVCDKDKALAAYEALYKKTPTLGAKIDIVLAIIRMTMFFDDKLATTKHIDRAKQLIESGGDWDRRNRLKAYQGLHLLSIRSFNLAAPLLLDSLSTFTSTEICSYETLVLYAVLAGTISLKRVDFKRRVIDSAEVLAVLGSRRDENFTPSAQPTPKPTITTKTVVLPGGSIQQLPTNPDDLWGGFTSLETLVNSLYTCDYKRFFVALAEVEEKFLKRDRILCEHKQWYVREMRRRAYAQLLESYRVVGLESMANAFGVSVDWLDRDLSRFIPSKGLNCTIDKVNGVIETTRPDNKNKQYQDVVKQGDALLTKLQRYGQAVRLRGSERV
ncbi:26S proteasome subunit RPN7-domain-containing protein [Kalaharituber pfeilii]|nr:26S proteasome subunit RPN7-domain-containing protein [Kalaharituber pfeilii]